MPKKDAADRFYDRYHAKFSAPDDHPWILKSQELMAGWLRKLAPAKGSRVLDLSCGRGYFLQAAHSVDPSLRLTGVDFSPVAVKTAQARNPFAKVLVADAMRTGLPSGSFDLVTCLGALEHYSDPPKGLREIHRLLAPKGRAFVYVPNLFFLGYIYLVWKTGEEPHEAGQNQYEHFYTRQGWEQMIEKAGFRVVAVSKHNEMYATDRVPGWMKALYGILVEPFVPLNLSYCFGFTLEKAAKQAARPKR
jgi:SAM-dependent methyltransferase